jgi:hypothetical protein
VLSRRTSPVADAAFASVGADKGLVPALWWFEVRNVLLMGERYGRIDPAGTAGFLADLDELPIRTDREPDSATVLALAHVHGLTFYDAAYLSSLRVG